jgi:hypothetical protein
LSSREVARTNVGLAVSILNAAASSNRACAEHACISEHLGCTEPNKTAWLKTTDSEYEIALSIHTHRCRSSNLLKDPLDSSLGRCFRCLNTRPILYSNFVNH